MEAEVIADKIYQKLSEGILKLPDEWHDQVRRQYMAPPVQIPWQTRSDRYFLIDLYVNQMGSLIFRIRDDNGIQLFERAFE
jgi:hypothetical protein